MKKLNDAIAKAHINRRIDRLSCGNSGDEEDDENE
jgi:putative component of toxin-antitoxin plasmid stabilization module